MIFRTIGGLFIFIPEKAGSFIPKGKAQAEQADRKKKKNGIIQRTMPFCVRENGLIIPRPKASARRNATGTSQAYVSVYASASGLRAQAWACASVLRYASASGLQAQA